MRRWQTFVNGERVFLKGANLAPANTRFARTTLADVDRQLGLARGADLNLVRPYAHVAHDLFYDRADELGMLVWQDLPLRGGASNSLRGQAVLQARSMVDQLGHHPSIFTWNAHVSPATEWMEPGPPSPRRIAERMVTHQLPTWSKSVLDRSIKRVFETQDRSRHASGFTGVLPHLPRLEATATHLWFGWRRGSERDLPEFSARWPSQVRFVAEFGAQSVPTNASFIDTTRWPDLDWDELASRFGAEQRSFDTYVPTHGHPTFDSWREATQLYQAGLLRRQIESLRRLKYTPVGGFCVHHLADAAPAISSSLVDAGDHEKLAYQAVADACQPVIVVADRLPSRVLPGDPIALDIHVVSDLDHAIPTAEVDAELHWPGGHHRWRFGGPIAADAVVRVGTLSWIVPDAPGLATLTLHLHNGAEVDVVNRYDTTIRP